MPKIHQQMKIITFRPNTKSPLVRPLKSEGYAKKNDYVNDF